MLFPCRLPAAEFELFPEDLAGEEERASDEEFRPEEGGRWVEGTYA